MEFIYSRVILKNLQSRFFSQKGPEGRPPRALQYAKDLIEIYKFCIRDLIY